MMSGKLPGLLFVLLWLPGLAAAEGHWYFGAGNGIAFTDQEDLRSSAVVRIFGGYSFNPWFSLDTSSQYFDAFTSERNDRFYVSGGGQTLGASVNIPVRNVSISLSAGAFAWQMSSYAYSEKIGDDDGVSPYAGFGVAVQLPAHMVIGGHSKFYHDVSGSDLHGHALFFGLSF